MSVEAQVSTVFAILGAAVIVFGGLWRLTRAIWRAAIDVRDNKAATQANTIAVAKLSTANNDLKDAMNGRLTRIEERLSEVERHLGSSQ